MKAFLAPCFRRRAMIRCVMRATLVRIGIDQVYGGWNAAAGEYQVSLES